MFRLASTSVLVVILAWQTSIATGDGLSEVVSSDGDLSPREVLWQHAAPAEQSMFPSAGIQQTRATSEYLSMNDDPDGDMPREVVFLADGSAAVIAHRDTDNVMFFDVDTQTITDTVAVGDFPVHLAMSPNNQYVVVANVFSNDVSIIDVASRTLLANVPITGEQPYRVAITPDSAYAIVGVINDAVDSAFSVIELSTQSESFSFDSEGQGVIGFFFTPEPGISGNLFTQFALSPDGTQLVLPDAANEQVAIYDPATGAELALLPVNSLPRGVDISADSTLTVISHETNPGRLTTIDLTTLSVLNSFSTSDSLQAQVVRLTPDKTHALAAISNNVIFTNLASGVRTATLNTGVVGDIELSYDGRFAFVSNYNARVIDIASQTIVKTMAYAACVDVATSPTEYRAVALNNRFREDIHLYNINGAAGFFEGAALSGPIAEGDATRFVSVSQDGSLAVASNLTSDNVAIIDMNTRTVRSYVDVGTRVYETAITPDNAYAVVCAADANYVRIVDLATDTVVKSLYVYRRPMGVRVSPDGQYAYVLNVASGDRLTFIHIDGANSSIVADPSCGETGSVGTTVSGIEVSHDGSIVAVCASFDDRLNLFDASTFTQIASVPVGDFPIRVAFSPDDTRAYVTNVFSDNLSVVEIDGSNSSLITNVGNMDYPVTVTVDGAGSYVYVANISQNAGIRVLDTSSNTFVKTLLFSTGSPQDTCLSWTDGTLYAISSESELLRIAAAGPSTDFIDATPLSSSPTDLAFANGLGIAIAAQPFPDGVDIVQFGCNADLDGDRDIDLSDLAELLGHYGEMSGAVREDGDMDGDGDVDLSDLAELLSVYGTNCP